MSTCSIKWCGKSSRTSNLQKDGITFHRFPKSPTKKEKWISLTRREENWYPKPHSLVCSRHFSEDNFSYTKNRRRLMKSAIPSLYLPILVHTPIPNTAERGNFTVGSSQALSNSTFNLATNPTEEGNFLMSSSSHLVPIVDSSQAPSNSTFDLATNPTEEGNFPTSSSSHLVSTVGSSQALSNSTFDLATNPTEEGNFPTSSSSHLVSTVGSSQALSNSICEGKLTQDLCHNTPTRKKRFYDATDVSPSMYDSPTKKRLCRRILEMKDTLSKKNITLRKQRDQSRKLKRKVASLQLMLQELEKRNLITEENKNILTYISPQCSELLKRQVSKKKSGKIIKKKYSPLLRSFALTLNFYSTKAYNYVRKTFDTCLPHIKTLGKWYRSIDGKPGFTEEAFQALKIKAEQASEPLYCCLVFDEMKIERKIEKNFGYVDFGASIDCDVIDECTDALVYLVVPLHGQWKVPIGYFMINSITADQKMFLVTQAIRMCREVNIVIKAVTFDGCPANISMAKKLKCNMNPDILKTVFNIDGNNVAIFLDPAHMIKLVRNTMEHYKEIFDSNGNAIKWNHIELLHELQETDQFHAANKLRAEHLFFKKNIMKVKLASQLFSRSVSVALKFCKNELGLQQFKDIDGTARMLMIINNLFDILDSKVHGNGLKRALNKENAGNIILKLKEYKLYITNLTTKLNGNTVRLVDSPRYTGFLGLCVCIDSLLFLYNDLVESNSCPYLSLHRISQDHIELLFCNIRSHGGANNNPTPKQFYGIYRKLLVHAELQQVNSGNCIELEKISILNCSSAVKRINMTTERGNDTCNLEDPIDECFIQALQEISLSQFSDSIIEYIAGAVVHYLIKSIKCNTCVKALVFVGEKRSSLIFAKDFGGLLYPSDTVTKICKRCELVIRVALKTNKKLYYKDKSRFVMQTLSTFINENLFPEIHDHQFDHENCNHVIELSRSIMEKYIDIRLLYLLRKSNPQNAVRRVYTKLIHFKNQ